MQKTHERIVVSVGGSLIVPDQIDINFLTRFKALILEKIEQGLSFVIIAGGGKVCRRYQEAAHTITPLSRQDLDWLGIHVTRLNAQLLRNIFIDYVYDSDPNKNPSAKPIERIGWSGFRSLIPPEWDPGLSSPFDPVAAKEAEALGLEVAIINGTKLDEFVNYLDGKPFIGTVIS